MSFGNNSSLLHTLSFAPNILYNGYNNHTYNPSYFFSWCQGLYRIYNLPDFHNYDDLSYMFQYCTNLNQNIFKYFNLEKLSCTKNAAGMFQQCYNFNQDNVHLYFNNANLSYLFTNCCNLCANNWNIIANNINNGYRMFDSEKVISNSNFYFHSENYVSLGLCFNNCICDNVNIYLNVCNAYLYTFLGSYGIRGSGRVYINNTNLYLEELRYHSSDCVLLDEFQSVSNSNFYINKINLNNSSNNLGKFVWTDNGVMSNTKFYIGDAISPSSLDRTFYVNGFLNCNIILKNNYDRLEWTFGTFRYIVDSYISIGDNINKLYGIFAPGSGSIVNSSLYIGNNINYIDTLIGAVNLTNSNLYIGNNIKHINGIASHGSYYSDLHNFQIGSDIEYVYCFCHNAKINNFSIGPRVGFINTGFYGSIYADNIHIEDTQQINVLFAYYQQIVNNLYLNNIEYINTLFDTAGNFIFKNLFLTNILHINVLLRSTNIIQMNSEPNLLISNIGSFNTLFTGVPDPIINNFYFENINSIGGLLNGNGIYELYPHSFWVQQKYESSWINFNGNFFFNNVNYINGLLYNSLNFNRNIHFLEGIRSLNNIFYKCPNFNQNIKIPNSVQNLDGTFTYCSNLNQNIQIPYGVKCIDHMFYGCSNLNQNIYIPDSVESMQFTFAYCNNLLLYQNLRIPQSVTHIDGISLGVNKEIFNPITLLHNNIIGINFLFGYANNDFNYSTVNIPPKVQCLQGLFYSSNTFNQNFHIPERILDTSGMFYNCVNLNQNINIPQNVQNTAYMFYNCVNLNKSVNIPQNVQNTAYMFYNCVNLNKSVNIPQNSKSKNASNMFYNCGKLKGSSITIYNSNNNPITLQNAIMLPYDATDISYALGNINFVNSNIENIIIGPYVTKMKNIFYAYHKSNSRRVNFYAYKGITTDTLYNNRNRYDPENPVGINLSDILYNYETDIYFYII